MYCFDTHDYCVAKLNACTAKKAEVPEPLQQYKWPQGWDVLMPEWPVLLSGW